MLVLAHTCYFETKGLFYFLVYFDMDMPNFLLCEKQNSIVEGRLSENCLNKLRNMCTISKGKFFETKDSGFRKDKAVRLSEE